jgi:hypothetical protein
MSPPFIKKLGCGKKESDMPVEDNEAQANLGDSRQPTMSLEAPVWSSSPAAPWTKLGSRTADPSAASMMVPRPAPYFAGVQKTRSWGSSAAESKRMWASSARAPLWCRCAQRLVPFQSFSLGVVGQQQFLKFLGAHLFVLVPRTRARRCLGWNSNIFARFPALIFAPTYASSRSVATSRDECWGLRRLRVRRGRHDGRVLATAR